MRTPDGGIAPDLELAFLDMSGTVFHDNGIMERAFERTVTGLGVDPGSERFRQMLHHVRDTLGQSKAGVPEREPTRTVRSTSGYPRNTYTSTPNENQKMARMVSRGSRERSWARPMWQQAREDAATDSMRGCTSRSSG